MSPLTVRVATLIEIDDVRAAPFSRNIVTEKIDLNGNFFGEEFVRRVEFRTQQFEIVPHESLRSFELAARHS